MGRVAVLGGGISGLSAAYYISRAQQSVFDKVLLLESTNRVGGWIKTLKYDDSSLFESGPRSVRGVGRAGYNTLEMVDDLHLKDYVLPIPRNHVASRNRFVYSRGKLCALPNSILSVLLPHPPFHKPLAFYGALEPFQSRSNVDDETVDCFFQRRFGSEIAMFAADPLCRGIFAGDSKSLSMRSCFPIFFNLERKYGSIVVGSLLRPTEKSVPDTQLIQQFKAEKWSMWSLVSGLQKLPDTLKQHLEATAEVSLNTTVTGLQFAGNKAKVYLPTNHLTVDHVICSLPAYVTAQLVSEEHPALAALLKSITFTSVAVVNIQYQHDVLNIQGFGHLIPSFEIPGVLGVLYESCIFPQHNGVNNGTRLTVMMGGAWFDETFGDANSCDIGKIAEVALKTVSDHLHIHEQPIRIIPNVHKRCIPHYKVGHHVTLQQIGNYIAERNLPITLTGASYNGVSVNDCIYNARLDVDFLLQKKIS